MKTIFFDIDTQIDFLYRAGALYVRGAESIVDRVAALNRWASSNGIPVISTVDAHSEDDPEFRLWPPHCVVETAAQQKPAVTLCEKRVIVRNIPCDLAMIDGAQQVIVEKQTVNCFDNVNFLGLVEKLAAERCVVYGVVTEICVKNAAFGLMKTGRTVEIVTDAVRAIDDVEARKMFAQFAAGGGKLTTVAEIIGV